MTRPRAIVCLCLFVIVAIAPHAVHAAGATTVVKAVTKYFGKEGAEQATEYLAKSGSREAVERVAKVAAKEGGEEAVEQVATLTTKYGPDAILAFDNAGSIRGIVSAIDDLPTDQVPAALAKLAAGESGKTLAGAVSRYGATALVSELKHPGVGLTLLKYLGDDGAELAGRMSADQAIVIARHADEISSLAPVQRGAVLSMIRNDTERVVKFAGRFVEANPGKTLFTAATTTVILAEPERFLGGDQIVFDAEGKPIVVSKPGIVGRSIESTGKASAHVSKQYLQPLFYTVMAFVGSFAAVWMGIKLWGHYRTTQS
ncbi:hypothetical protein CA13_67110 [Planctomycetes bacterium CA13]|uniref:Uncharacterized protein n=1 Tax=Novipirellula herctigrandis TaxID=2527986 RepID=A0A5C5YMZ9_9BACT|nr:hypothetical protein CA13_67110 [Planctomycetes bacterium CA13]